MEVVWASEWAWATVVLAWAWEWVVEATESVWASEWEEAMVVPAWDSEWAEAMVVPAWDSEWAEATVAPVLDSEWAQEETESVWVWESEAATAEVLASEWESAAGGEPRNSHPKTTKRSPTTLIDFQFFHQIPVLYWVLVDIPTKEKSILTATQERPRTAICKFVAMCSLTCVSELA